MYRYGWGWLRWALLAYFLLFFVGRAFGALTWVEGPSGFFKGYDSTTGALVSDPFGGWSQIQTLFNNGTVTPAGGFSYSASMPSLSVSDGVLGDVAVTGVEAGLAVDSGGLSLVADGVINSGWSSSMLGPILQVLESAQADSTATCTQCVSYAVSNPGGLAVPPGACTGGGETFEGYVLGTSSSGVVEVIGAVCLETQPGAASYTFCLSNTGGAWLESACQASWGVTGPANPYGGVIAPPVVTPITSPAQAVSDWGKYIGVSQYHDTLVNDLGKSITSWPSTLPGPSVAPGVVTGSYTGPAVVTGSPVSSQSVTSTGGSVTTTVTPSVSLSYGPGGVLPSVSNTTCVGTNACSTSAAKAAVVPFVPPTGMKFPANPVMTPKGTALSFTPTVVPGVCPPPILLKLTSDGMGSYSISLQPFCVLAADVEPVVVASSAVLAGFIIFAH